MMSNKPDDLITAQQAAEMLGRSRRRVGDVPAVDDAPRAAGIDLFNEERVTEDEATASTDRERREAAAKRQITSRHRRPSPGSAWAKLEPNCCEGCGFYGEGISERPITPDIDDCPEQRAIAGVYSNHPAYENRWAQA
ncbi:DUF6221 family protein [Streptomyces melanogenes]|uniref:DUF6221 family protein n=1 Tax=Streptomyces melanogenes TaxID=67326 RepID=UPI00167DE95F|nr:DUF6221 family protein [Streptomyces melanogenes]GGP80764.1 hypothetical protein GCM10010278_69100 [Streptomyces melanogenes]